MRLLFEIGAIMMDAYEAGYEVNIPRDLEQTCEDNVSQLACRPNRSSIFRRN